MKLSAGITELTPSWETILNQLGLPIRVIPEGVFVEPDEFPAIILSRKNADYKDAVIRYLNNGGTVLTEADTASSMLGIKARSIYLNYLLVKNDEVFNIEGICDIKKRCYVAKGSNHLGSDKGINALLIARINKGTVIVLPSGFVSLINDHRIARKNFFSQYAKKETNERVSVVSKGMVSHIIRNSLEHLYASRNLPFVSLWHFPGGSENIFSIRIDTDFGSREGINELYSILKSRNLKATWFIETKSAENFLEDFKNFDKQETALHCYRHRVFLTRRKNYEQLNKALSLLKSKDIPVSGFAAPYGEWNRGLGNAVSGLGFCYSSEFGFVYDSLPLFPSLKRDTYTSLQVPVHPMSLGRLYWGGHNSEQMLQYYQHIFAQKASGFDPLIIYFHPSDLKFKIIDRICNAAMSYNFPNFTFREYAGWWKKRGSISWEAVYNGNNIKLETSNQDESFWMRILNNKKEVILKPLLVNSSIEKKLHDAVLKTNNLFSAEELRKKTKRMMYHDLLTFYRKLKQ